MGHLNKVSWLLLHESNMSKSCHGLRVLLSQLTQPPEQICRSACGRAQGGKNSCVCVGGQVRSVLLGLKKASTSVPESGRHTTSLPFACCVNSTEV